MFILRSCVALSLGITVISAVGSCGSSELESASDEESRPAVEADPALPQPVASLGAQSIEATVESSARWPSTTPCEASIAIEGSAFQGVVMTMWSARLDGETHGRPWTWAEIESDSSDEARVWIAFSGGQIGDLTYSADHALALGDRVIVFIGADTSPSPDLDAIAPMRNAVARFTDDDGLATVYGTIAAADVGEWLSLQENSTVHTSDFCEIDWVR